MVCFLALIAASIAASAAYCEKQENGWQKKPEPSAPKKFDEGKKITRKSQ